MVQFLARYFDGQTSHAHDVTVQADAHGTLQVIGLASPLSVPAQQLRISARLGNTTRSITFPNGAKLESDDNDAVDRLQQQLGVHSGFRIVHFLESRWKVALGCVVVLALLAAGWLKWGIPVMAEYIARRVPKEMAFDIGAGTLSALDRITFEPTLLLPEDQDRLQTKFQALAASYRDLPLHLVFRHAGFPNAFALPDGTIVVTDELVYLADSDEQVLAVLCHEVGHLYHRHALRMALESSTMALLIGTYLGDATQMAGVLASLPTVYTQAHYSRNHESEADTFALDYLRVHDIAPHHFADILSKLEEKLGGGQRSPEALQYLSSHPPTRERIARFR